ncbi:hypothetical protein PHMEG_00034714 [Phytophthora megakarya]|uniref:Uncharacterized protein n=1 Tax=Phytophthora megakarya TaxID=4795 RepID=A0A225UQE2_9STRA|nr:hypothetical protein PHMEG_00034714 [Phytophthora megakarya]
MSDRHRGKDPAVYVTSQIRAEAVMYKSLPRTLPPAYDWGFGVKGLSITYFKFMDRKQRMQWKTREVPTLQISKQQLTSNLPRTLQPYLRWSTQLACLGRLHSDFTCRNRCRLDDPLLQENIQDIQECRGLGLEEKAATTTPVAACSNISIAPTLTQLHFDQEEPRKDMIQVPPRCQSEGLGGGHEGRAHFVPKSLDLVVKVEIKKRFGGLKRCTESLTLHR